MSISDRTNSAEVPEPIGWTEPVNTPAVLGGEVHVWAARLDVPAPRLRGFRELLSGEERERANRYRSKQARDRFAVGRGLLRVVLGNCLKTAPARLTIDSGARGKLALGRDFACSGLEFNLAHSADLVLVAISRAGRVGVDVERIRPIPDAENLVGRFFSPRENASFAILPTQEKQLAFFNLWTRKEAWLKATGEGITESLHAVEVSFLPGEPPRLLAVPGSPEGAGSWTLLDLKPEPGFAAALAVETPEAKLNCWRFGANDA